jgi:hypothetical protein
LAPPCSSPFSVPIAAITLEYIPESVLDVTRAENADAFSSWSACSTRQVSNCRTRRADGSLPRSMYRKFHAIERPAIGCSGH